MIYRIASVCNKKFSRWIRFCLLFLKNTQIYRLSRYVLLWIFLILKLRATFRSFLKGNSKSPSPANPHTLNGCVAKYLRLSRCLQHSIKWKENICKQKFIHRMLSIFWLIILFELYISLRFGVNCIPGFICVRSLPWKPQQTLSRIFSKAGRTHNDHLSTIPGRRLHLFIHVSSVYVWHPPTLTRIEGCGSQVMPTSTKSVQDFLCTWKRPGKQLLRCWHPFWLRCLGQCCLNPGLT